MPRKKVKKGKAASKVKAPTIPEEREATTTDRLPRAIAVSRVKGTAVDEQAGSQSREDGVIVPQGELSKIRGEELEALGSIFEGDFDILKPVWGQTAFRISSVQPFPGDPDRNKVKCDLVVIHTSEYPAKPPMLRLDNVVGLSHENSRVLLVQLEQEAATRSESHPTDPYILDLVMFAREFLVDHNHSQSESFHEEYLERQRKKQSNVIDLAHLSARPRESEAAAAASSFQRGPYPGLGAAPAAPPPTGLAGPSEPRNPSPVLGHRASPPETKPVDLEDVWRASAQFGSKSRYRCDFEELEQLGRGGFGEVVKARNRLDGNTYAVKRVKLERNDDSLNRKILREVTSLAKMFHHNIVRYYQAWIEDDDDLGQDGASSDEGFGASSPDTLGPHGFSPDTLGPHGFSPDTLGPHGFPHHGLEDLDEATPNLDNADLGFDFYAYSHGWSEEEEEGEPQPSQGASRRPGSSDSESSWSSHDSDADDGPGWGSLAEFQSAGKAPEAPVPSVASGKTVVRKVLYIQMECCDGLTLREAIEKDLYQDQAQVVRLLRQLVEALFYVHYSAGLIHRDLKPENVFLQNGVVKLGDFGLATDRLHADPPEKAGPAGELAGGKPGSGAPRRKEFSGLNSRAHLAPPGAVSRHPGAAITEGVGTSLYRAPEVLQQQTPSAGDQQASSQRTVRPKASASYDQKCDMWSLGMVLFEMLCPPFTTGMERFQVLTALRTSFALPPGFRDRVPPELVQVLRGLVQSDPAHRMSSRDLLESGLLPRRIETEEAYFEEVLHAVRAAAPSSAIYSRLIDALFHQQVKTELVHRFELSSNAVGYGYRPPPPAVLAAFARPRRPQPHLQQLLAAGTLLPDFVVPEARNAAVQRARALLERQFRQSGAVALDPPLLLPAGEEPAAHAAVSLLNDQGMVVRLPSSLTAPMARWAALRGVRWLRRFGFGQVFAPADGGGQPRSRHEASVDILADPGALLAQEPLELDALVLAVASLAELGLVDLAQDPQAARSAALQCQLFHARIQEAVLALCDVPADRRPPLLVLLSAALQQNTPWGALRKQLVEDLGLSHRQADELRPFVVAAQSAPPEPARQGKRNKSPGLRAAGQSPPKAAAKRRSPPLGPSLPPHAAPGVRRALQTLHAFAAEIALRRRKLKEQETMDPELKRAFRLHCDRALAGIRSLVDLLRLVCGALSPPAPPEAAPEAKPVHLSPAAGPFALPPTEHLPPAGGLLEGAGSRVAEAVASSGRSPLALAAQVLNQGLQYQPWLYTRSHEFQTGLFYRFFVRSANEGRQGAGFSPSQQRAKQRSKRSSRTRGQNKAAGKPNKYVQVVDGGRYDDLVQSFRVSSVPPALGGSSNSGSTDRVFALGTRFHLDRIARLILEKNPELPTVHALLANPSDEVDGMGFMDLGANAELGLAGHRMETEKERTNAIERENAIRSSTERMEVAGILQSAGFSVEWMHSHYHTVDMLMEQCRSRGILFLLVVKRSSSLIRVRTVPGTYHGPQGVDREVKLSTLTSVLQNLVHKHTSAR